MAQTLSRTPAQFSLFNGKELVPAAEHGQVLRDLPPWLRDFVREALRETETLRQNGAEQAAAARTALLTKLAAASGAWLDAELHTGEAAREAGVCEETIRRAVREGHISDRRANPKGRHRVRRGDLQRIAGGTAPPYDPIADAQSIAQLRRKL
jgi:hypothetical protein